MSTQQMIVAVAAIGALTFIIWVAFDRFTDASELASVLGVILPALAAIATAAFGIPYAHQTGKTSGKNEVASQVKALAGGADELAPMGADQQRATLTRITELADTVLSGRKD